MAAPNKPKYVDYTIAPADILSNQTDFSFVLDLSRLPSVGFWDTVTSGDDLVAYTPTEVQLDTDCVYFDAARETGVLVVKDNPDATAGNTLRIYFGEAGAVSEHVATAHGADCYYASYDGCQTDRSTYNNGNAVFTGAGHTINANGGPLDLPWVAWTSRNTDTGNYSEWTANPPAASTGGQMMAMRRDEDLPVPMTNDGYYGISLRHTGEMGLLQARSAEEYGGRLIWFHNNCHLNTAAWTFNNAYLSDQGEDIETPWHALTSGYTSWSTSPNNMLWAYDLRTNIANEAGRTPANGSTLLDGIGACNSWSGAGGTSAAPRNWDVSVVLARIADKGADWRTLEHRMFLDSDTIWTIGAVTDNPDFGGGAPIDITINDIEVSTELDNVVVSVGAQIDLTVADLEVAAELDQPTLTRGRTIAVQGLEVATELDAVTVTKAAALNIADLEVASELDNVTVEVSQGISLAIQDVQVAPEFDNVQIARGLSLNVENTEITPESDNVPVGKETSLTIADLEVQPELDNVVVGISTGVMLAIQDVQVATEMTGDLVISRHRTIAPAGLEVSTELDTVDMGLNLTLAINDIDIQPEPQNIMLSIPGSQVFGSTNNVLVLTPESTIMTVT